MSLFFVFLSLLFVTCLEHFQFEVDIYIYIIYIHMAPLNMFSNIASKFKSLTAGWLQRPNRPNQLVNLPFFVGIFSSFFDGKTPTFSNESLEMLEILQVIHSKGDHSDSLLIVLRGGVRVCMGDECLRLHGFGQTNQKAKSPNKGGSVGSGETYGSWFQMQ